MKKHKSLQVLALAGLAVTLATGCSSTSAGRTDSGTDERAAYRMSSSAGWTPITDVRQMNKFPLEWNPMVHESYIYEVKATDENASGISTASFDTSLQPGDTFVEAAGADAGQVKRVIQYTPFAGGR